MPGGDFMGPYFWGGVPFDGPYGMTAGLIPRLDSDLRELPEEVREALELHHDEIYSAADLRDMAEDLMLRR